MLSVCFVKAIISSMFRGTLLDTPFSSSFSIPFSTPAPGSSAAPSLLHPSMSPSTATLQGGLCFGRLAEQSLSQLMRSSLSSKSAANTLRLSYPREVWTGHPLTTHICAVQSVHKRGTHRALGSSHTDCSVIFVRLKRVRHLVRTCLTLYCSLTSTLSSSFSLPSTTTPEHAALSGQHDHLQKHPGHHELLQAPPDDKQRHQESLWRENLQSGGNPRTTTPTGYEPKELATVSRIEDYSGDPYNFLMYRKTLEKKCTELRSTKK